MTPAKGKQPILELPRVQTCLSSNCLEHECLCFLWLPCQLSKASILDFVFLRRPFWWHIKVPTKKKNILSGSDSTHPVFLQGRETHMARCLRRICRRNRLVPRADGLRVTFWRVLGPRTLSRSPVVSFLTLFVWGGFSTNIDYRRKRGPLPHAFQGSFFSGSHHTSTGNSWFLS